MPSPYRARIATTLRDFAPNVRVLSSRCVMPRADERSMIVLAFDWR